MGQRAIELALSQRARLGITVLRAEQAQPHHGLDVVAVHRAIVAACRYGRQPGLGLVETAHTDQRKGHARPHQLHVVQGARALQVFAEHLVGLRGLAQQVERRDQGGRVDHGVGAHWQGGPQRPRALQQRQAVLGGDELARQQAAEVGAGQGQQARAAALLGHLHGAVAIAQRIVRLAAPFARQAQRLQSQRLLGGITLRGVDAGQSRGDGGGLHVPPVQHAPPGAQVLDQPGRALHAERVHAQLGVGDAAFGLGLGERRDPGQQAVAQRQGLGLGVAGFAGTLHGAPGQARHGRVAAAARTEQLAGLVQQLARRQLGSLWVFGHGAAEVGSRISHVAPSGRPGAGTDACSAINAAGAPGCRAWTPRRPMRFGAPP